MKYCAVLFDLDGTLLDTLEDISVSLNNIFDRFNLPTHPREAFKYFVGEGVDTLVSRGLPADLRNPEMVERIITALRQEYGMGREDATKPYPGMGELLDNLTALKIRMAILSNKPERFTRHLVNKLLGRWRFEHVVGATSSTPMKPNPISALRIADAMDVKPAGFLYLGDSGIDMMTAVRAGMYPVGATWGFRTSEELKANGAKLIINRPEELLPHL